jgi:acyl carrier protein
VQNIVRKHGGSAAIAADALLGAEGLGLDSVAIAEVVLDCETRFGVELTDLLNAPLTVGVLTEAIAARS